MTLGTVNFENIMAEEELSMLLKRWQAAFQRATDFDMWGQPVEAIDVYQRLSKQLHQYSNSDDSTFSHDQKCLSVLKWMDKKAVSLLTTKMDPAEMGEVTTRTGRKMKPKTVKDCIVNMAGVNRSDQLMANSKTLEKVAVCLDSRERALQTQKSSQSTGVSLNDLKRLESTFQSILGNSTNDFPLDVSMAQVQYQQLLSHQDDLQRKNQEERAEESARGSLLPRPLPVLGMTLLTVRVDQIGLKDAYQFIDPFITVSVKDSQGQDMTVAQDTPPAQEKQDSCIVFSVEVHIQKAIESLPPGFAVFFELKHYKPKKQTVSTRCWACLEKDEIREGPVALELYKKPPDYRRKNIHLLTVKPLYLHLRLQLLR